MKWEYKKAHLYYRNIEMQLNDLGKNRWELCCLLDNGHPTDAVGCNALLKRSVKPDPFLTGPK